MIHKIVSKIGCACLFFALSASALASDSNNLDCFNLNVASSNTDNVILAEQSMGGYVACYDGCVQRNCARLDDAADYANCQNKCDSACR